MIVKCVECELQVSDKAWACPHCGFPMQENKKLVVQKRNKKKRRLPNGFGQISEIRGQNLRNPFRAMVTVGKTSTGKPICKPLKPDSYFATYNDAYAALVEYNKNPYDLDPSITVKQLYDQWSVQYFETLKADSSSRTISSAWAYCSTVYDMRVSELRARHIKGCIEDGVARIKGHDKRPSAGVKGRIKSLFNLMLDYALEYELTDRNYARTFNISDEVVKEAEEAKRGHIPFSDNEMKTLWNHVEDTKYVDVVLIQCYSGWRPQELGLLMIKNINFKDMTMMGGMKTSAGIDRLVPIHPIILPLIKKRYREAELLESEYLINCTDGQTHFYNKKFTYDKYLKRFAALRDTLKLNPQHRPHDGRKHFVTMAKKAGVDEYAIKYIVGHSITDITEKVYTERDSQWLKSEIEKISQ